MYNIYRKRKRLALVLKHNFHCCGEARRLIAGRKVSFRNRKWRKTQTDSFSAVKLLWGLPVITQRCVRHKGISIMGERKNMETFVRAL